MKNKTKRKAMRLALPEGLIRNLKQASADLVFACGGPGAVEAATGISRGQISRWQSEAYPDLIPAWAVWLLEHRFQLQTFTRSQAAMTGFRLEPMAGDGDGDPAAADLVEDIGDLAREHSEAIGALAAAHKTRSPAAIRTAMREVGELADQAIQTRRGLALVAGGR